MWMETHSGSSRFDRIYGKYDYKSLKQRTVPLFFSILDYLRVVRNQVAHVGDRRYNISIEQALSYGKTAEKIIKILQNLKR